MTMIDKSAVHRMYRAELLALLKGLSYEEREVTLASGRKSDFYIDCKQTILTAKGHFLTGWLMLRELLQSDGEPPVQAVGGLTMGADPIVSAICTLSVVGSKLPGMARYRRMRELGGFYVRKEPKAHGTSRWIEGAASFAPETRVAIVEDVITTGGSAIKAIRAAREQGFKVERVIALVDRQEDNGRENLKKELGGRSPDVTALFQQSDFREPKA